LLLLALSVAMGRRWWILGTIFLAVAQAFLKVSIECNPTGLTLAFFALATAAALFVATLLFHPFSVLWTVIKGSRRK
jgi:hypothetical protein